MKDRGVYTDGRPEKIDSDKKAVEKQYDCQVLNGDQNYKVTITNSHTSNSIAVQTIGFKRNSGSEPFFIHKCINNFIEECLKPIILNIEHASQFPEFKEELINEILKLQNNSRSSISRYGDTVQNKMKAIQEVEKKQRDAVETDEEAANADRNKEHETEIYTRRFTERKYTRPITSTVSIDVCVYATIRR